MANLCYQELSPERYLGFGDREMLALPPHTGEHEWLPLGTLWNC